jgi:hypothetical protein
MASVQRARRAVGAALITSILASVAAFGSAAADNPDDLTVSGESTSTITLTLAATTAAFGTNLTPTGAASNGDADVSNVAAAGACYEWDSSVAVSSNVAYQVGISSAAANADLDFMTADPTDYAACTGGTAIVVGSFVPFDAQTVTADRDHDYWLGLDVTWLDGPSSSLGDATLTFEAVADV